MRENVHKYSTLYERVDYCYLLKRIDWTKQISFIFIGYLKNNQRFTLQAPEDRWCLIAIKYRKAIVNECSSYSMFELLSVRVTECSSY